MDDWLMDFAVTFRDYTGVDVDQPAILQEMGWEKMQAGLDAALSDDKAPALFEQAMEKFKEATAMGARLSFSSPDMWLFSCSCGACLLGRQSMPR